MDGEVWLYIIGVIFGWAIEFNAYNRHNDYKVCRHYFIRFKLMTLIYSLYRSPNDILI